MAGDGIDPGALTDEDATIPEDEAAAVVDDLVEDMRWKAEVTESLAALQARLDQAEQEKASLSQAWEERMAEAERRHRESEDARESLRREVEEMREAMAKASTSPLSEAAATATAPEIPEGETPTPEATPEASAEERARRRVVWV